MSLRNRLILTVVGLLALGLVGAAAATFAAVRDYQFGRAQQQLTEIGRDVQAGLLAGSSSERAFDELTGDPDRLWFWRSLARSGAAPALIQLRSADGSTVLAASALEDLPPLPERLLPAPATSANPDGQVFQRLEDARENVQGWRDRNWLVRTAWLGDRQGVLVVGLRMSEFEALLRQLVVVEVVVTLLALGLIALLGWWLIRRGMRPLDRIAATASAIGEGDLTRRVERADARTEVGRLGLALNSMLAQVESAFQARSASEARLRQFVADASHELRTPIATVRGYAELCRRGAAERPADLAMSVARIESEAERMGLLVSEMLLLARLDQGRPLEASPVDLVEVAAGAVAAARAVEPDRSLRLECTSAVVVAGDADRLRQVLDNLLANVRLHTPASASAVVRVLRDGEFAVVEVADQGPGLTASQCARVFERFYRVDSSRSHGDGDGDNGGSGLGLAIVSAIAGAHGGEATVSSAPGAGACFRVRLPLACAPSRVRPGAASGREAVEP